MTFNRFLLAFFAIALCEVGCEDKKQVKSTPVQNSKDNDVIKSNPSEKTEVKEKVSDELKSPKVVEPSKDAVQKEEGKEEKAVSPQDKSEIQAISTEKGIAASFSDGSTISRAEVSSRINLLPEKIQKLPFSQLYNLVLFVMIQEKLAHSFAIKEQFDKNEEVQKQLQALKDSIANQYYLETEAKKAISDTAIEQQYQDLIKDFKPEDMVHLKHILVRTKEDAAEVLGKLEKGESFDELQKIHSIDPKASENHGDLDFFRHSQLPKEEADLIMGTPVGQVVKTPISVPKTGYSVLFVTEKKKSSPAPLENVKARIEGILLKRSSLEQIGVLYQQNKVVLFDPDGKERPYKTIDVRLAELKERQKRTEPSKEDVLKEQSIDKLKDTSIVARLGDGTQISFAQVSGFIKEKPSMFKGMPPYEVFTSAVEEYINKILLSDVMTKNKIFDIPAVKEKIDEASTSFIAQKYLSNASEKMITEERLRKIYDEKISKIDKNELEFRLTIIPVKSMEEGTLALDALKKGEALDAVMKKFCADQRFAEKKGDLGYLRKEQITQLSPELYDAVVKTAKASLCVKPIPVKSQIFVVRVEDKRTIELPKYQQAKALLKRHLVPECMAKVTIQMIEKDGVKAYDSKGAPIDLSEKELERTLGGEQ